jgi:hypothetical protein
MRLHKIQTQIQDTHTLFQGQAVRIGGTSTSPRVKARRAARIAPVPSSESDEEQTIGPEARRARTLAMLTARCVCLFVKEEKHVYNKCI